MAGVPILIYATVMKITEAQIVNILSALESIQTNHQCARLMERVTMWTRAIVMESLWEIGLVLNAIFQCVMGRLPQRATFVRVTEIAYHLKTAHVRRDMQGRIASGMFASTFGAMIPPCAARMGLVAVPMFVRVRVDTMEVCVS